jgi:hypothetical protein
MQRRFAYLPWVFDGRRLLAAGDAAAAATAFGTAERLAPGEPRLKQLREDAERKSAEQAAQALRDEAAAAAVEEGQEAFEHRRFTDAVAAADRALSLSPENEEAKDLAARADFALNRQRRPAPPPPRGEAPAGGRLEAPAPSTSAAAAGTAEESAAPTPAPAAAEATIAISFHSEQSQGVLTIYADERQLLRESFKFTERQGFLRSKAVPGDLSRTVTLPSGRTTLRVYVTLDRTRVETIQGNFPPGAVRNLDIRVSQRGDLTVSLR